ncbi:MAG: DUF839 domain-containing protein [Saprospiraceae bacterium]
MDAGTGAPVGADFRNPDNLASDSDGNIYIIEDNTPGDIWLATDADNDGIAESIQRWASLGAPGAEPTGFIATNNPDEFLVCIQHPSSGNDAIWKITRDPNAANLLDGSANLEASTPFLMPGGFTQTKIVDRNTANNDADFSATFGDWDMIALDPSERYVFIPIEEGTGAGLTRYDRQTGDFIAALTGNNSGVFSSDPQTWDPKNDDFGALDPAVWTPWGSIVTGEEWASNGRLFEWKNPLQNAGDAVDIVWQSKVPSVSHEGVKFDADGNMYFVDENTSGSVYKFVPENAGDLSSGQTFVLTIDAFAGDAAANWNDAANTGQPRTGAATWVAITDVSGTATTVADPFDFTNRGGRLAADEVNATPYGRPEDLEIIGTRLFFTTTSEHSAYSIDLNGGTATVQLFADQNSLDAVTGTAVGSEFRNPDNLASDASGNVYIIEDNEPGDVWKVVDADNDGVAESMARFISLSVDGAEPTGFLQTSDPNTFLVCIQHPASGNDALWSITADPNATLLSHSASVIDEDNTPFLIPAGFSQSEVVDRNTANMDPDFVSTFGDWDMIALDPANEHIFIPHEEGTGAGLSRFNMATGDFVVALAGDNSGNFNTNPKWRPCNGGDFGALDPATWTPSNTVLTGEEWSGNGRLFEWMNPLMAPGETPEVRWLDAVPSMSHEGVKFDANGTLYLVDENNSGSLYKFVPKTAGDYAVGQTFVLSVDGFTGDASANWNAAANATATRVGPATWIPITDQNGAALTAADPFFYDANRGGRAAADEVNATPYGRPEDLEIVGNMLYCNLTSENSTISVELQNNNKAVVRWFVTRATLNSVTGAAVDTDLNNPDNLASDANGTIYIIEDNNPGDIWKTVDANHDGVAESMARFASLGVAGSEPTGFVALYEPNKFLVSIQHPSSGNDALWIITAVDSVRVPDNNKTLEQHSADELLAANVQAVHKNKVVNMPTIGYGGSDKTEGIALLPGNEIAIINDNDFGIAGAGVTDDTELGIISFNNNYGFDASNQDDAINIANHPTLGMFMPDGIAAYTAGDGKSYIVTANEGDSRDYDGYSEEERVKDLDLDPAHYPNADELQKSADLGRLKTTSANGDFDGDGDFDQIYSYGARSFSIFDIYGNLVYDSGNDFETIIKFTEPEIFNEDEGEFDGRSDDKGPEPEAIEIATIDGYNYAFVGFERQSTIVVYDITDPTNPEFVTYYNNRNVDLDGNVTGDVSPEIIKFVSADDSPNGQNLLVVGYEVSGTVGIIQIGGELSHISEQLAEKASFKAMPNPATEYVYFDQPITAQIFDENGRLITSVVDARKLPVTNLPTGVYNIVTTEFGSRRFLKM